jgi:formylglycine-generating enzyme required for sulfatase activity
VAYLLSPAGADACGSCLTAADKFLLGKQGAAAAARTRGMVLVQAGEYQIGSPAGIGDPDEQPRHAAALDAFYLDARETTVADYMKFAEATQANYPEWAKPAGKAGATARYTDAAAVIASCPSCPVMGVTHKDAAAYCAWAGKRLPTEAEWEAAARGGSETAYSFGDSPAAIGEYAWYEANSGGMPRPTGTRKANPLGLFDMHGNVWEWTADLYDRAYYEASPKRAPAGPEKGRDHVLRGGSWAFEPEALRSGNRASSGKANDDIGFRCAAGKAEIDRLAAADVSESL